MRNRFRFRELGCAAAAAALALGAALAQPVTLGFSVGIPGDGAVPYDAALTVPLRALPQTFPVQLFARFDVTGSKLAQVIPSAAASLLLAPRSGYALGGLLLTPYAGLGEVELSYPADVTAPSWMTLAGFNLIWNSETYVHYGIDLEGFLSESGVGAQLGLILQFPGGEK